MRGEFVDLAGKRLYYYAAGTRGTGVPIVLVHGFPTSSRLWHSVARDFPDGHRLVIVDLPGFGRSEADNGPLDCATHAQALRALLDDLRIDRACLVGHGMGGGVVQRLAVDSPERVSHLALLDSAAFGIKPRRLGGLARKLGSLARFLPPGLLAGLVHGAVRRGFAVPERSRITLDTCLQPFTTEAGRGQLQRHLASLDHCDTGSITPRLTALAIPTAIMWGADDPFYPVVLAERLQAAIPHATLDVIPGASHFTPEDAPDRVITRLVELVSG